MKNLAFEFNENNYIKNEISEFKNHIITYQKTLNNEGVWLFLATLGCWSVTNFAMQKASFILTIIIFGYRVYQNLDDSRSFKNIYSDIEIIIAESNLEENDKNARLSDLLRVKKKYLRLPKLIKTMIIFCMCFAFTIVSYEIVTNA